MSDFNLLKEKARQLRVDTLNMNRKAGTGHVGGSYSTTEPMFALFHDKMELQAHGATKEVIADQAMELCER